MKFVLALSTILLIMSFSSTEVPYAAVERGFKSNDAKAIVSVCKEKTLINIEGTEGVYSKSQATLVLKNFFTKNPGSSFSYVHKGKGSGDGSFAIGKYNSKSGEFRVTIQFKKIEGSYKIESLAIEK